MIALSLFHASFRGKGGESTVRLLSDKLNCFSPHPPALWKVASTKWSPTHKIKLVVREQEAGHQKQTARKVWSNACDEPVNVTPDKGSSNKDLNVLEELSTSSKKKGGDSEIKEAQKGSLLTKKNWSMF